MPHGTQMCQLCLKPRETIRGALHLVALTAAGRNWSREHIPELIGADGIHWLMVHVQGMGDLNSVDIAQALHEGIIDAHGALWRDHLSPQAWNPSSLNFIIAWHLH